MIQEVAGARGAEMRRRADARRPLREWRTRRRPQAWAHAMAPLWALPRDVEAGGTRLRIFPEPGAGTWGGRSVRLEAAWTHRRARGEGSVEIRPASSPHKEVVVHLVAPAMPRRLAWRQDRLQRRATALADALCAVPLLRPAGSGSLRQLGLFGGSWARRRKPSGISSAPGRR